MEPQQIPSENEQNVPPVAAKKVNISIPAAIITGAAIIALAIIFTLSPRSDSVQKQAPTLDTTQKEVSGTVATLREQDYVRGQRNAEVVVIEYSDSDCPFCKQFHDTMKEVVSSYKGKVAWVYRFFPLVTLHPNAYTEAVALHCVGELGGDTAFWTYLDTVIAATLAPDAKSNEALINYATAAGIDASLFKSCVQNESSSDRIDAEIKEAGASGARGTPFSVVINQKTGKQVVIPGAVPFDYMKQVVDSLLK